MCAFVFFFFNDTAATGIYPYGHTLSLHDALPILPCARSASRASRQGGSGSRAASRPASGNRGGGSSPSSTSGNRSDRRCRGGTRSRSEEHTSELQSLMRISYAVFCLKKKTLQLLALTQPVLRCNN